MNISVSPHAQSTVREQPLTQAQLKFWTAWRLHSDRPVDSPCMRIEWIGLALDVPAFVRALSALVNRTDSLRLRFSDVSGRVCQYAQDYVDPQLDLADFSDQADPLGAAHEWLDQFTSQPIDLTQRIFTTALAKIGEDRWLWQFNQHHIATDFSSAGLLIQRLSDLYGAAVTGPLPESEGYPSYLEFISENRAFFSPPQTGSTSPQLSGRLAPTVSKERQNAIAASTLLMRRELYLGPDRLARAATKFGVADDTNPTRLHSLLYNLFLATTAVLVARVSRRSDITIGTPTHNRYLPGADDVTGLFIRMLPLSLQVDDTAPLSAVIDDIRKERRKIFAAARKGNEIEKAPFNVVLNHITTSMPDFHGVASVDLTEQRVADAVGLDLSVTIRAADKKDDVKILFDVNEDILGEVGLEDLSQAFLCILDAFLEDDDTQVGAVALTGRAGFDDARELAQLAASVPPPPFASLPDGFVAQSGLTPDAPAVSSPTAIATYAEVEEESRRIASALVARGVRPGDFVALKHARSVDLVIAMLGIMRSGAAICGIDADIPHERARLMIDETGARIGIFDSTGGAGDWAGACDAISLDQVVAETPDGSIELPTITPESAAYVMYTSGTTGAPKGIVVPHGSAARCVRWFHDQLAPGQPISWAMASTLSFEAPYRIFTSLVSGGCAAVYPAPDEAGRLALMDVIDDDAVDALTVTPSQLRLLVMKPRMLKRIRVIQIIGEQLSRELASAAQDAFGPDVAIENWFGPTETTMATTRHRFDRSVDQRAIIPVGKPAPDATVHVLDAGLNPVPRGMLGELCIGGIRLSSGYLKAPDAARAAFVADPFHDGGTLYRSGDLGRIDENGHIVHHGRIDDQVKVNGVRVELSEVEANLLKHDRVAACAVVATGTESIRLAAFCVSNDEIAAADLKSDLAKHLPAALIPSTFKRVEAIPLSKNGKVDRKALKAILAAAADADTDTAQVIVAPATSRERQVVDIWHEVLGTPDFSCDSNFFDAGGDSISFVHMVLSVEEKFGVQFPPTAIDGNCTLSMLAKLLDDADATDPEPSADAPVAGDMAQVAPRRKTGQKRGLLERLQRRATGYLRMRKLRTQEGDTGASAVSPELLRQLRLAVAGWPGEPVSDTLPIFAFNRQGRKPPLFWCFNGAHEPAAMAERLGPDQPLYAFRSMSKVVMDKTYRRERSGDLARMYALELARLEPTGPYHVGGNCQAGRIAEFVARSLMLNGKTVPQLSLLEYVPATPYPGRIALFFGADSGRFNPFFEFEQPQVGWQKMHREVVWDIVPGGHAQYFDAANVGPFVDRLKHRLTDAEASCYRSLSDASHAIGIELPPIRDQWAAGDGRTLEVGVANRGETSIGPSTDGSRVVAGLWRDAETGEPVTPAGSAALDVVIPPGSEHQVEIHVQAPETPGRYVLQLGLCEPGIGWLDTDRSPLFKATVTIV